jgi:uncharacterized protein with ATP-grasp and redox domains
MKRLFSKIISVPEELRPVRILRPSSPGDYLPVKGVLPQRVDYGGLFFPDIFSDTPIMAPLEFARKYLGRADLWEESGAFSAIEKYLGLNDYGFGENNLRFVGIQEREEMFRWLDSAMKVFADNNADNFYYDNLRKSMQFFAAVFKMASPDLESGFFMRNLDSLSANLLRYDSLAFGFGRSILDTLAIEPMDKTLLRNEVYLKVWQEYYMKADLREFMAPVIYSGNCLIDTNSLTANDLTASAADLYARIKQMAKTPLRVDDSQLFVDRILSAGHMVYVPDDNGETVFDLALLQRALESNPNLQIYIVANKTPVSNNVDIQAVQSICQRDLFKRLYANVHFLGIDSCLEVPLCKDLTLEEQRVISNSDVVMVKGQMFFEYCDMYKLNPHTFYFFVSSSAINNRLTGVKPNEGIVAHIPSAEAKYRIEARKNIVKTLLDLRAESAENP